MLQYCRRKGIAAVEVDSINSDESVQLLRKYSIDLCVFAGAGILRRSIIEATPLGVLNAHMGLLPLYRGMNVAEWAVWNSHPVGCSVHLIDCGIDTGDILLVRTVDASEARDISELRRWVDREQIQLLGEVVKYVLRGGKMPPRRAQRAYEGLQYFRMHAALLERLNARLDWQSNHVNRGSAVK